MSLDYMEQGAELPVTRAALWGFLEQAVKQTRAEEVKAIDSGNAAAYTRLRGFRDAYVAMMGIFFGVRVIEGGPAGNAEQATQGDTT